jgi:hypothetical protein
MKNYLLLFTIVFTLCYSPKVHSQEVLVESEFLSNNPSFLLGFVPGIPAEYDVDYYKLTYNTVDTQGEPTIASGAIAIPVTDDCNTFPLAVYCHGTVLKQLAVPSEENTEGLITKVFSSTGFIAVAPDYIGLGESTGVHPYVHAESQATATIDLIRAAKEFLETQEESDNGETYITGYSQGGHAAMATVKYAQDNGLSEELGISGAAPCSGPYNLSGSQASVLLSGEPYSNPGYVVYLIIGYERAYGNIYEELGDIIQSPYDEDVQPFFDGMQNEFTMAAANAVLPNMLDEILVDSVLTAFENNPNHPLRLALADNDNFDWAPEVPLRMYYCTGDEQVSSDNSVTALDSMQANGATDVDAINSQPNSTHGECVLPALSDAYQFFADIATPCGLITGIDQSSVQPLDVYPNPASARVQIKLPQSEEQGYLIVQDTWGRIMIEKTFVTSMPVINVEKLAAGTYVMSVKSGDTIRRNTLIVE